MREILFKAKRLDNGECVDGFYCCIGPVGQEKHYIIPMYASAFYGIEVDPSTVCQYTGLTDKFFVEKIFEYDIIDSSSGEKVGNYYENKEILKRKSNFVVERMGTKKWHCSEQKAIKCGCRYAE